MTLPRGFKAQAERHALEFRQQLAAPKLTPIDLEGLAALLNAQVISGETLVSIERFQEIERLQVGAFSAATFVINGTNYIVTNPLNSEARRRSDIAHELGHLILKHELSEIREVEGVPFRSCKPEEEEQASALGATILLPTPVLKSLVFSGIKTAEKIAESQNVSVEMARYRLHTSGVLKITKSRTAV